MTIHVPLDMRNSPYIFLRREANGIPLQKPYEEPSKVLQHGPVTFVTDLGRRPETVSVASLRPPHLGTDQSAQVA
ncbi:hypothetical protein M513_12496 [Trichuris suis]|uniref:Uncharacterized protein n=1 Tax=Trichuris suis TaxID=68888 RepID=A0A085LNU5_9BILA|nr:hypothetical protein M513_12496 [Trichuris suis]